MNSPLRGVPPGVSWAFPPYLAQPPVADCPKKGMTSGRRLSVAEADPEGAGGRWLAVNHIPCSCAATPSQKGDPRSPHRPRLILSKSNHPRALAGLQVDK